MLQKKSKILVGYVVVALVVSLFTAHPASAAQDVRVDVRDSHGSFITVTNVVETNPAVPMYIADAPAVVTFQGETLSLESIVYYPTAELQENNLKLTGTEEYVKFDVKKYTLYGDTTVHDELQEESLDIPLYVTGNYATLSKPGYYYVNAAPEAAASTYFVVQIVAPGEKPATAEPETVSAAPTASKVLVNGKEISFEAYNINGSNYFKLRDLATVVSGTAKQFEVTWDGEKNAINLITGKAYTPVGGELAVSANPETQKASPTASRIYVDGQQVQFTAYTIGGNNYFKLRDIAKVINFGVTWDEQTSTIGIVTSSSYSD